ncbi:hypothetical protein Tco_1077176 [Tanacetum coccineum]
MHNDIMEAGSKEPKPATATQEAVPEHTVLETYRNTTPRKRAYNDAKAEAIHMILNVIGDGIYSTVDASRNANPLALDAATQRYSNDHYQAPKPHKTYAPSSKQTPLTRSHATTKNKGKDIVKPITPPSESASEEDSDEEHAQRDKQIHKNLALLAKHFKNIYKPTNNLKTSSNTRNKNVDTSLRTRNDNNPRQFMNQRTLTVVGARETVGNQEVLTADSEPTYDAEPLEHVQSNDDYNVFATER